MQTLPQDVARRIEIKKSLSVLAKEEKELRELLEPLERSIIKQLEDTGMDAVQVSGYSLKANTQIFPSLDDKEKALKHIAEKEMWELLPASILQTAFRELLQSGESIPGVTTFEKTTLSVRKLP